MSTSPSRKRVKVERDRMTVEQLEQRLRNLPYPPDRVREEIEAYGSKINATIEQHRSQFFLPPQNTTGTSRIPFHDPNEKQTVDDSYLTRNDESGIEYDDDVLDSGEDNWGGTEHIWVPNPRIKNGGEFIHYAVYFGQEWTEGRIRVLDDVPPLKAGEEMTVSLHPWQAKGAAQIHHLCTSPSRGAIVADSMGLGKTLQAVVAIYEARHERGSFSLVVCPKATVGQWVKEITDAYKEEFRMTVFVLDDPSVTAHELHNLGADVVISTYEFIESQNRQVASYGARCARFLDEPGTYTRPSTPGSALHSNYWAELGLPIRRLVLDECHKIKNIESGAGQRFKAIQSLYYTSIVLMSGTFLANKWQDCTAFILLLKDHPIKTKLHFKNVFVEDDYELGRYKDLEGDKIVILQRLLMAYTIARPSALLELEDCMQWKKSFSLEQHTCRVVLAIMNHYNLIKNMASTEGGGEDPEAGVGFAWLIKALLISMHSGLCALTPEEREKIAFYQDYTAERNDKSENIKKKKNRSATIEGKGKEKANDDEQEDYWERAWVPENHNLDEDELEALANAGSNEDRESRSHMSPKQWEEVKRDPAFNFRSSRVTAILETYSMMRKAFPEERMVIFSPFVRFLEILEIAFREQYKVPALLYHGQLNTAARTALQEKFEQGNPSIPLLMSAHTGAYGINLQSASIVIQDAPWWNRNTELQAWGRCHRFGQTKKVKVVVVTGENSPIDAHIMAIANTKEDINNVIMGPLVRRHDEKAKVPPFIWEGIIRHE